MPTAEQWEKIEAQLSNPFGKVELICDGYSIVATPRRVSPLKYEIMVYVDGFIRGEWIKGESEIPLKFHREQKRLVASKGMRAWYEKASKSRHFTKAEKEEFAANAKKTLSLWTPGWTNAKSFIRHIKKTCQSIEVVTIGYES